jgi:hypothetical protein
MSKIDKLYYYTDTNTKCVIQNCTNLGKNKGKVNNLNQVYKSIFCESHLAAYHRKKGVKEKKTKQDFDNEMETYLNE